MKSITTCFGLILISIFTVGLNFKPVNAQTLNKIVNQEIKNNHCDKNEQNNKHSGHDHSRCKK